MAIGSGKDYWITGVKKSGTNRHWAESDGPVMIEQSLIGWFRKHSEGRSQMEIVLIPGLPKPDIRKLSDTQHEKFDQEKHDAKMDQFEARRKR